MRRLLLLAHAAFLIAGCGGNATPSATTPEPATARSPVPDDATRLFLVRTADWTTVDGTLAIFRREPGGAWQRDGEPTPVVVGRSGMGWGRGLHGAGAPAGATGPSKAEGDGRSPAGVFTLGGTYGYDAAPPAGVTAPYAQLTPTWQCVDDSSSDRYNTLFDTAGMTASWSSFETMRRDDALYTRVVFVEHNTSPATPGGGSCIFLHVWRGPGQGTSGCTAMELPNLERAMATIDPGHTVLVALPDEALHARATAWSLPAE